MEALEGKYNVILADPPWKYHGNMPVKRGGVFVQGTNSKSENHYPSLTDAELMSFDIKSICDNECVLYMWSTAPVLKRAIAIGESWGFQYSQVAFVWNKDRISPGNYTLTQCEFVLVFRLKRGKLPKRSKTNVRQFFSEKPREHSRKPEYVQDMLDFMYPGAKKIELFARRSREGWDAWGNETTKFDSMGK